MVKEVRLFKPSVGAAELEAVQGAFSRAWLGLGPKVTEFEKAWSSYIGARESVGLNSATAALHLAVTAFGFKPGAKVLVPALTFMSTAAAPMYNGLEPVFVDCDAETLGMSLTDLERKASADCVAVIPVHFGGHPVPMEPLLDFARARGLKVIEDCAHCAGGTYHGKKLGTWGDIGCFSFEEKKCMTTGDGGMMSSDDPDLLNPLRAHRWVGIDKDTWKRAKSYTDADAVEARHWHYEIAVLGYKYNMNDLAASIGLVQLAKLDRMNEARNACIRRYLAGIADLKSMRPLLPYRTEGASYWIFGVRCAQRDALIAFLKKRGIATGVHYMPLPMHPLFAGKHAEPIPVATREWQSFVTLPLFADLTFEEVDYVVDALCDFDRAA